MRMAVKKIQLVRQLGTLGPRAIAVSLAKDIDKVLHFEKKKNDSAKTNTKSPNYFADLLKTHGFALSATSEKGLTVTLEKKMEDEKGEAYRVELILQAAQSHIIPEHDWLKVLSKELLDAKLMNKTKKTFATDKPEYERQRVEFAVLVTLRLKTLILDCEAVAGTIKVKRVSIAAKESFMYAGHRLRTRKGPLSTAFADYLGYLGINKELLLLMEELAKDKRKKLNIEWINDIKKRISAKIAEVKEQQQPQQDYRINTTTEAAKSI